MPSCPKEPERSFKSILTFRCGVTHSLWYSLADGDRGKRGLSQVFELNGTPNIHFQCPVGHPYSHTQNMSFFPISRPNANMWVFAKYIHMCFSKLALIKIWYFPSYQASVFSHIKPVFLHMNNVWQEESKFTLLSVSTMKPWCVTLCS